MSEQLGDATVLLEITDTRSTSNEQRQWLPCGLQEPYRAAVESGGRLVVEASFVSHSPDRLGATVFLTRPRTDGTYLMSRGTDGIVEIGELQTVETETHGQQSGNLSSPPCIIPGSMVGRLGVLSSASVQITSSPNPDTSILWVAPWPGMSTAVPRSVDG